MRRGRAVPLAVVVCVFAAGCSHVTLSLPSPDADLPTREAAFERLRPKNVTVVRTSQGAQVLQSSLHSVVLGSGDEVAHPEDFLPVVRPNSVTARNVAAYQAKARQWNLWGSVALTTFLVPIALAATYFSVEAVAPSTARELREPMGYAAMVAVPVGLVGPLVSLIIGAVTVGNLDPLREACFRSYPTDLREALALPPGGTN